MHLKLLPVHSKLADPTTLPPELAKVLPPDWALSQHQVDTYQALLKPEIDVVINTAMTGDGKSLAAYLPTLVHRDHHAFGMYPTIELSRDQERQFSEYAEVFGRTLTREALWGAKLGQLVDENPDFKRRAEALATIFNHRDVILTNPDIFSLVMNYRYESGLFTNQELPYSLARNFNDFIFDEFHIFAIPQIISALTAMVYFRTVQSNERERPRFLFLSATTDPTLIEMIQRSGLKHELVKGDYVAEATAGYRAVLHASDLTLHQCDEQQDTESWIRSHLDIIKRHWDEASGDAPKGVIIVNSVASARRIAQFLSETIAQSHQLTIGENTGLVDDERRKAALLNCDIVVGTSTIDVGVDFNISFLLFEAVDAGSFLQRLGRLGRVRRNGQMFDRYEAHAIMSSKTPWIYSKIQTLLSEQSINDNDTIERPTILRSVISEAFPQATNFRRYTQRWGALQAAHIVATLEDRSHGEAYSSLAQILRTRYAAMLGLKSLDNALKRYWAIAPTETKKKRDRAGWEECKYLCDEILSFRGSSPFQVGLWDASITPPAFLSYDAFSLLQSATYTVVSAEAFKDASRAASHPDQQRSNAEKLRYTMHGKNEEPLVLKVFQFNAEREILRLTISAADIHHIVGQIIVLSQFAVQEPRSEAIGAFNAVLKHQQVVSYITKIEANELRRRLKLPAFFPLYRLFAPNGREYTIAFGKSALLLEAEALFLRDKDPDTEPIFC